jgi:hypothetical protein
LLRKCPDLVELEIAGIVEVLTSSTDVITVWCNWLVPSPTGKGGNCKCSAGKKGKGCFCTSSGGLFLNLSPEHKMNQDETKDKVENAHDQNWSTSVCNKWEGII